ncbi:MAG: GatB/YqeY domain-containing protein [Gammaproteobacteria bacterium]|jgi:uncharacterized protein YqeY
MSNSSNLKNRIQDDMKAAMRAREQQRLDVIRFLLAAIKQREIDEKITLDDVQILSVIEKQIKQLKDAITQYKEAGRNELVQKESFALELLQAYMPAQLSDAELETIIKTTITETGAASIRDMGKVMGVLKAKIQGQADMGKVSSLVKKLLGI